MISLRSDKKHLFNANYGIFDAKIYDYTLIDSFWGSAGLIDGPKSYAIWPLCILAFPPFMAHHNIFLHFELEAEEKEISIFHEFPFPVGKKCQPAADSILMPSTFHIANLDRYAPNFSGVPHKLTCCCLPRKGGTKDSGRWSIGEYNCILPSISILWHLHR